MSDGNRIADPFVDEVIRLHSFLNAWLKGEIERGDGTPACLADALAGDFVVIHPTGTRGDREASIDGFAKAYGEKPPGYALEVSNIQTRIIGPGLCLATYEERHRGEPGRERVASAVLRRRADGQIEWLQLQETPAPGLAQVD